MEWYQLKIKLLTAFATPIKGDTLFGQLCWTIREQLGNSMLEQLLSGYNEGKPFVVVSDPMPAGSVKKPCVPAHLLGLNTLEHANRKQVKKLEWIPDKLLAKPLAQWHHEILLSVKDAPAKVSNTLRYHNTINRLTDTTGTDEFAPFSSDTTNYAANSLLQVYLLSDGQLDEKQLHTLFTHIGLFGYGKEASTGLGKFEIVALTPCSRPGLTAAKTALTLAPCVANSEELITHQCYYQPFTRFGRHGAALARSGKPFKNPVLMLDSGALLTFQKLCDIHFTGRGLGGNGQLSDSMPQTVQQGYAPVVLIH